MTLQGSLDGISLSGYVEGWAYDTRAPLRPLPVCVIDSQRRVVARGLAGGYRKELAYEGHAAGWCGVRLKLSVNPLELAWKRMTLVEAGSRRRIVRHDCVPYLVSDPVRQDGIEGLIAEDPTVIGSLDQLRACDELFKAFIKARGAEAFVRAAYRYVLGRPADRGGRTSGIEHLRSGSLSPFGLIQTLGDSDEYRSNPRQLCAPVMAAFPFRVE